MSVSACAVCAKTEVDLIHIDNGQLREFHNNVCGFQTEDFDGHPPYMCKLCISLIKKYNQFQDQCQASIHASQELYTIIQENPGQTVVIERSNISTVPILSKADPDLLAYEEVEIKNSIVKVSQPIWKRYAIPCFIYEIKNNEDIIKKQKKKVNKSQKLITHVNGMDIKVLKDSKTTAMVKNNDSKQILSKEFVRIVTHINDKIEHDPNMNEDNPIHNQEESTNKDLDCYYDLDVNRNNHDIGDIVIKDENFDSKLHNIDKLHNKVENEQPKVMKQTQQPECYGIDTFFHIETMKNNEAMAVHELKLAIRNRDSKTADLYIVCNKCCCKVLHSDTMRHFLSHEKSVGRLLYLHCDICDEIYHSQAKLDLHKLEYHNYKYICEMCSEVNYSIPDASKHFVSMHNIEDTTFKTSIIQYCDGEKISQRDRTRAMKIFNNNEQQKPLPYLLLSKALRNYVKLNAIQNVSLLGTRDEKNIQKNHAKPKDDPAKSINKMKITIESLKESIDKIEIPNKIPMYEVKANEQHVETSKSNEKVKRAAYVKKAIDKVNKSKLNTLVQRAIVRVEKSKLGNGVWKLGSHYVRHLFKPEEMYQIILDRKKTERYKIAPYKCQLCFKGFMTEDTFSSHKLKHDKSTGRLKCDLCKYYFSTRKYLNSHIKSRHTYRYQCTKCDFSANTKHAFSNHRLKHLKLTISCDVCQREFRSAAAMYSHKRYAHPSMGVCNLCGKGFTADNGVFRHKLLSHRSIEEKQHSERLDNEKNPSSILYCKDCDLQFLNQYAFDRHLESSGKHTEVNLSYRKDMRDIASNWRSVIKQQSDIKNKDKDGNIKIKELKYKKPLCPSCTVCGIKFKNVQKARNHYIRYHPNDEFYLKNLIKIYKCDKCDYTVSNQSNLNIHKAKHSNEKPFKCPQCDMGFKSKGNMQRHVLLHTDARHYECAHCSKRFSQKSSAKLHIQTVHLKIPYPPWQKKKKNKRITTKSEKTINQQVSNEVEFEHEEVVDETFYFEAQQLAMDFIMKDDYVYSTNSNENGDGKGNHYVIPLDEP